MAKKTGVAGVKVPKFIQESHIQRVVDAVNNASPMQFLSGFFWYPIYPELIVDYAKDTGLTRQQRLALFAVLSPQRMIQINWRAYAELIDTMDPWQLPSTMIERIKCYGIMEDNNMDCLSGIKVLAFNANLSGNLHRGTIDRHAASYIFGVKITGGISDNLYYYCESIFVIAAERLGLPVAIVQAIAWIFHRDNEGISNNSDTVYSQNIAQVISFLLVMVRRYNLSNNQVKERIAA